MPRILVVEDDAPIADLISDELRARGFQAVVASNGAEALDKVAQQRPDAIVLDLMMPKLNGWDFVEQYRDHTGGQTIPIAVVSAAGAVTRSMESLGVKRFLPKPFEIDVLERCIAEVTTG